MTAPDRETLAAAVRPWLVENFGLGLTTAYDAWQPLALDLADALLSGPLAPPAAVPGPADGVRDEAQRAVWTLDPHRAPDAEPFPASPRNDAPFSWLDVICAVNIALTTAAQRRPAPGPGGEAVGRVRALAEKAIPGPWLLTWDSCDCGDGYGCSHGSWVHALRLPVPHTELSGDEVLDSYKYEYSEMSEFPPDTVEFIAAARDAIPVLLAAVERLAAERDEWERRAFERFEAAFSPEEGTVEEFGIRWPSGVIQRGGADACRWTVERQGEGEVVRRLAGPWRPAPPPSGGAGEAGRG